MASPPPPSNPPPGWTYPPPGSPGYPPGAYPPPGYGPYPPPGYAPYPGPPTFPTDKTDSKIITIIIVVVAVVVLGTAAMAAILYFMVSGLVVAPPPGGPPPASLVLTAGTWNNGNITLSFAAITNGARLHPQDLTYMVQSSDGTTYFSGRAGTSPPVGNVTVSVAYQDNANHGQVSNEDTIRLTVDPSVSTALRGGSIRIFFSGEVIGFINQLP